MLKKSKFNKAVEQEIDPPHAPDTPAIVEPSTLAPSLVPAPGLGPLIRETSALEAKRVLSDYECLVDPLPLLGANWNPTTICDTLTLEFPWIDVSSLRRHLALVAAVKSRAYFQVPPILLVGPPGTGKSSFARRLAELGGVSAVAFNAAGGNDARTILGTARGWSTATPGLVPATMRARKAANFLVVIEDLDRSATLIHPAAGRVSDALLNLTERSTARAVFDECLQVVVDCSAISWVITCNSLAGLDEALISRCHVVRVQRPTARDFAHVERGILASIAAELGCDVGDLPEIQPALLAMLRRSFTGARNLRALRRAYVAALSFSADAPRTRH